MVKGDYGCQYTIPDYAKGVSRRELVTAYTFNIDSEILNVTKNSTNAQ